MNAVLIRIVCALGLTQIIGWGSLYYSVAVLAKPMADSLQCDVSWVFGAFSAALVVSGLCAPHAGRAIDRFGGRAVLAAGSVLAAASLLIIALAPALPLFIVGWLLAGAAMSATLYDAAFPALSQLSGTRYRSALTALTLFGGLASTAFWPLAWRLHSAFDWRVALISFAALQLFMCFPLHRWALPRAQLRTQAERDSAALRARVAMPRSLLWLGIAFALNAFVFSAIGAHIVAALSEATASVADAVWIAALIGPMQVTGRIMEFVFARRVAATRVGVVTFMLTAGAMLLLWQAGAAGWVPWVFALVYGAANGVTTIVRGNVPAELYGREDYGALMGRLAQPSFFAKALAPVMVSLLLSGGLSYAGVALLLAVLSLLALVTYLAAIGPDRHAGEQSQVLVDTPQRSQHRGAV
ncbi:MFS transporter [Viridibacterium curvum]|uniref:Arsenite efflux MFS transporter ArsK n=1 Tax=Viridibacterium curvum TaxID=1101404 RepID=A0ABP9Q6D6_9RHOO